MLLLVTRVERVRARAKIIVRNFNSFVITYVVFISVRMYIFTTKNATSFHPVTIGF